MLLVPILEDWREELFWAKVNFYGPKQPGIGRCWVWCASVDKDGYGQFNTGTTMAKAHRLAYVLTGRKIASGKMLCHHCDNTRCVNPRHLFQGTSLDNVRDMDRKGRRVNVPLKGADNSNAKLTFSAAYAIRQRFVAGVPYRKGNAGALAAEFGVSESTIRNVAHGKHWAFS